MNPLIQFWNEEYRSDQSLETDATIGRLVNRHVVAALMNAFPRTATRIFSCSSGELGRLLFAEREGGSFRVLRAMYRYGDRARGDLLNRLLMQSPAVKAARNRRRIAQRMLEVSLNALPQGRPILVLAVGGGDGSLEADVIARMKRRDVYYCGVDRDERAVGDNLAVLKRLGLEDKGCTLVGSISNKSDVEDALESASRRLVEFRDVGVCVCQGIAEYLDLHRNTNESFTGMLRAIHSCTRPEGRLIISHTDNHDRVKFLEEGLSWYMRLRGREELGGVVQDAGWQTAVCEREPMKLITMCLAHRN